MNRLVIWVATAVAVVVTTGLICTAQSAATTPAPDGPSLHVLKNLTYKSAWTRSGKAKLTDGAYREPTAPGSATRTTILLSNKVAYGKLNGRQAAAVILVTDPGGSGTFYDLAMVILRKEKPVNVAVTNLGDRVIINSLSIRDNRVVVDLVVQRRGEPMPSPTLHIVQAYSLKGSKLTLTATREATAVVPAFIGTTWKWEKFQGRDGRTIIVDQPENYTIQFLADGKVSVRADCNRGSGTYKADKSNLSVSVMAMTRAACPPESLSDQYVPELNNATSYGLQDGKLHISLNENSGTMIFTTSKSGN